MITEQQEQQLAAARAALDETAATIAARTAPRKGEYLVPAAAEIKRCASCKAEIVWLATARKRPIPISVATIVQRDGAFYGLTHFTDCAQGREWSKKGKQS